MDGERMVQVVMEHVELENAHDFPACIAKFARPRYEVVAENQLWDGHEGVHDFLAETRDAFPDFHFVARRLSPSADAVWVEGNFKGTQLGSWRGLPATGRKVDVPMCIVFDFEGDDMVGERLYFDVGTALQQLGVAFDPNSLIGKLTVVLTHPVTITKALARVSWLAIRRRKT